ncbi:hypothetical protein [Haloplanus halophilus]|uniref:hypothetical protein n=1 Tax=Haloplanus halophilus TaxID=2949993 RepID=UPI00203D3FE8|nr:hypothetical protein [Haloplanus sp. GDY1]
MAQYEPFEEGVEARGRVIIAIESGLSRFREEYRTRVRAALSEKGIDDPNPDDWYPQGAELDVLATIAEELEPHLLDRLGEQIPAVARWPSGVSGVAEGLRSIDDAYHRNHRGGEIGHYRFEKVADGRGRVECRNPYPCPFDRGLIRAVARQYSPVESFVFVEERGERCRREGADRCTYVVHW